MFAPRTLADSFVVEGVGLHTGEAVRVHVHPAPPACGRYFLREGITIPALTTHVTDCRRCTTLSADGASVRTVEHLLAALMLAEVDNAAIEVDGPELPALDGSALRWWDEITRVGIVTQAGVAPEVRLTSPRWQTIGGSTFFLAPADALTLYAAIDVPDTVARAMTAGGVMTDPAMRDQAVRARTYGLEREVQALLDAGLARGGSLENAVVLTRDGYLNAHVWPDEPAWHKVLDLAGDLALIGARVRGQIIAIQAGHYTHVALAEQLRAEGVLVQ